MSQTIDVEFWAWVDPKCDTVVYVARFGRLPSRICRRDFERAFSIVLGEDVRYCFYGILGVDQMKRNDDGS